jgi:hypothetical protein
MANAHHDDNRVPTLIAVSNVDGTSLVDIWANPTTHGLLQSLTLIPETSGGLSIYRNIDIDETGVNIKDEAGMLYGWYLYNNAATTRYIKFYNVADAPTVGTDTPVLTIPIPAGSAANVEYNVGIAFDTGIGIGAVTGVADNNTGAPDANDCVVNILYY